MSQLEGREAPLELGMQLVCTSVPESQRAMGTEICAGAGNGDQLGPQPNQDKIFAP